MTHKNLFIGIDGGASFCRTLIRDMQGNFVLADGFVATIACGNSHRWLDMHDFVTAREALKLDHKLDWAPSGGRSRRQSFAFGRAGPDAHGCVRQLIDMPDTDHRLRPVAVQDARQFSPSAARNCVPIREVLTRVLPKKGIVLEIGSGTGEHVVCFAKALPRLVWLPSDPDGASRTSIEAWMTSEGLTNVRAPVSIDVREKVWGVEGDAPFDAILSLNMVHIAPWQAALGLLAGGKRLLRPDGILFLYGPFMIGGRHTATTNAAFDADLKQRDPRWGVRDVDDIVREAMPNGLALREVVEMPANNLSLVLVKSSCLRLRTVAPAAPAPTLPPLDC